MPSPRGTTAPPRLGAERCSNSSRFTLFDFLALDELLDPPLPKAPAVPPPRPRPPAPGRPPGAPNPGAPVSYTHLTLPTNREV